MESFFISTSGGMLSNQMLDSIYKEEIRNAWFTPDSYNILKKIPIKNNFEERMLESWENLCIKWDSISNNIDQEDIRRLRNRWIEPLFKFLGYPIVALTTPIIVENNEESTSYLFAFTGWENGIVIHSVAGKQDLDKRDERTRFNKHSPHDYLQQYLNTCHDNWGIVTNGKVVRLLTKHHLSYTKGYVEFNIAGIFESRNYREFKVLYKLLHCSRFTLQEQKNTCIMDEIYNQSISMGTSIGDELKYNIKAAIEELGNGFLDNDTINILQNNEEACNQYYSELLIVVYRVMFLLFAEQRGLFAGTTSLYMEEYSISSLRYRVEQGIPMRDEHTDLWEGLKVTFKMVEKGIPSQGIFAYNGLLFSETSTKMLNMLKCTNREILKMIDCLTLFEKDHVIQRISYVDLGVEQLGSIYENLLDFTPRVVTHSESFDTDLFGKKSEINIKENSFFLDPRGMMRKQSGSYYTRTDLVEELIQSALVPVVEQKLNGISNVQDKVSELLSIKVCDPACGSGHFLIAANNYLGLRLAKLRCDSEYPSDREIGLAKRDVLIHCIYGVDINPMAVELAKVSLWINACVKEYPLNFLDHHIKCGNSLVGTTSELMRNGIPSIAFERDDKEEKKMTSFYKKKNKEELENGIDDVEEEIALADDASKLVDVLESNEDTPEQVHIKNNYYNSLRERKEFKRIKLLYDMWVDSFYADLSGTDSTIPTQITFNKVKCSSKEIERELEESIEKNAQEYKFFHWEIEFPEVFLRSNRGFDCVLGNPPWEAVVLKEKEFFIFRNKRVFEAETAAKRKNLIESLKVSDNNLYYSFKTALRDTKSSSHFIRNSGKYTKSAKGTINTYAVFTDLASQIVADEGRLGLVIETGIATNDGTKELFGYFVNNNCLVSIIDFENKERIFPIHSSFRFCLFTATGIKGNQRQANLLCYATNIKQLEDKCRYFSMSPKEFELVNPLSKTVPSCRNSFDKEIMIQIYNNTKILRQEYPNVVLKSMFHMSGASDLFMTERELQQLDVKFDRNYHAHIDNNDYLPLYEAKLMNQYIFNYATFEGIPQEQLISGNNTNYLNNEEAIRASKPRYWMLNKHLKQKMDAYHYNKKWVIGLRDVTGANNERTSIATVLPLYPCGNTINCFFNVSVKEAICILLSFNSFVFDFIARMKVGGMHLNVWIAYQQPIISYRLLEDSCYLEKVKNNILQLIYYHESLRPFAKDLGYEGEPFRYTESIRLDLQSELDAIAAKLYGVNSEQLSYILDTFTRLKKLEIDRYGEFRSKRLVLEYFNKL